MKNLKKILSVILTAAMLFALAGMVMAEGAPSLMSMPTPERIFAVVNDYSLDYGMLMSEYGWMPHTDTETGEHVNISNLLNEDGTFKEETKTLFVELADESEADGSLDADSAQLLRDAETLTDILRVIAVFAHLSMINTYPAMIEEAEAEGNDELVILLRESQAAYGENYPDWEAVYPKMINDCFGGNAEPSVGEILNFLSAVGDLLVDDEGFLYVYDSDFAETPEDTFGIYDIIAPTGAFTASYEMYGGHRNVYEQLRAEWDAGNIDNEEAFAILFGYAPDVDGYLRQVVPEYNTLYDENGKRVKNVRDVINDDGTVLDSGLSVRDFAIAEALKEYEDESIQDIIGGTHDDSYMGFMMNFLFENIPFEEIMNDIMGGEGEMSPEETVTADIDSYIEYMKEYEGYEGELEESLLMVFCGVEYDLFGYVAMGYTQDYLTDADGNTVKLSDVMAEDGKLLYPEMGESVQVLMAELLANMSYDALLLGDVNADGSVNLSDVSAILKKVAGWEVEVDGVASDTNGDGTTTLSDVSLALQYIAGWDVVMGY